MSFFDLDPQATQNAMDNARLNPIQPDDLKPGWFAGAYKAPVTGLASVVNDAALLVGDAGTTMLRPAARSIDTMFGTSADEWLKKEQQKAVDNITAWAPDPRTTGVVGQMAHGLINVIPEALLGGPETAAVLQGYKGTRKALNEGLDQNTALGMGAIDAVSTWVGMKLPMHLGSEVGALANIGAGAAINVPVGMTTRGATGEFLRQRGYTDMADQYKVLDSGGMITDAVMGAAFGGLAHYGPGITAKLDAWSKDNSKKVLPSDIDTALGLNNQLHMELDTAPGIPTSPATRAAHVDAMNSALESLLKGEDVNVDPAVTYGDFLENPTSELTHQQIIRIVEDHMGPEWDGLQSQLRERGLPDDTELYSLKRNEEDRIPWLGKETPIRITSEIGRMTEQATKEGWTADRLITELTGLHERLDDRNFNREAKDANRPLQRGELWVRERMMRAERNGEITPEAHNLVKWLLDKNPAIADDLALSFIKDNGGHAAGSYNPAQRLVTILKEGGNNDTAAHEILHHTERMMPNEVQRGIRAEWVNQIKKLTDTATRTQNHPMMQALADAVKSGLGDAEARTRLIDQINKGDLPYDFYQYTNPSEFWAVNGARLISERAGQGWAGKAATWLKDFIEHIKSVFGLDSDHAVIKGLDAVMRGDGEMHSQMIYKGTGFDDVAKDSGRPTLADVRKQWSDAGIENYISESKGKISLSQIIVSKGERGSGKGTAAMGLLIEYADKTGQRIELTPDTSFGGSSRARLTKFYKEFGFVENKGRNKDFTTREGMYREPVKTEQTDSNSPEAIAADNPGMQIPTDDGQTLPAHEVLAHSDAEIASAKQDSQGYDAAVACALRG